MPPSLDATFGALEIGSFLSMFLLGVVTTQSLSYYRHFPKDSIWLKSLVAFVWLLELAQTILVSHTTYNATVTLYGRPELLGTFSTLIVSITVEGVICLAVQGYFTLRLWKLLRSKVITAICCSLSIAKLVGCIASTWASLNSKSFDIFREKWSWLVTSGLVVGAALDVVIAACLCWYFVRQRRNSLKSSVRLLDKLILWTLQTGLMTCLGSLAMTITYQVMPSNFIWVTIFMFLAKLYSLSLLATLNARARLRQAMVKETTDFASHELQTELPPGLITTNIVLDVSSSPEERVVADLEKQAKPGWRTQTF